MTESISILCWNLICLGYVSYFFGFIKFYEQEIQQNFVILKFVIIYTIHFKFKLLTHIFRGFFLIMYICRYYVTDKFQIWIVLNVIFSIKRPLVSFCLFVFRSVQKHSFILIICKELNKYKNHLLIIT